MQASRVHSLGQGCPMLPPWYLGDGGTNVNIKFVLFAIGKKIIHFWPKYLVFCQHPWHCGRLATVTISDSSQLLIKSKAGSWIYRYGIQRNSLGVIGAETPRRCRWRVWTIEMNSLSKAMSRLYSGWKLDAGVHASWLSLAMKSSCLKSWFFLLLLLLWPCFII